MIILPAIDLYDKKAVRLYKGDYAKMTVYSENPPLLAEDFRASGAEYIHLVDLEGARDGKTPNFPVVAEIARMGVPVEVGGGIRNGDTVKKYLDAGVSRVILGTAALQDRAFLIESLALYGEKIAVGVDLRDGFVAVSGWTKTSGTNCFDFCSELEALGVRTVICTDISRDGAMRGANCALYKELNERFNINLIASGGVSAMADITALREMGLYGAIVGKAYYTGAIDLRKAIEVAK